MNDKIKRRLQWIILNAFFAVCLYYGMYQNAEGARNILIFSTPFLTLSALIIFFNDDARKLAHEKGRPVPKWIDRIYDFSFLTALTYSGSFILGTLYAIHMLFMASIYNTKNKD